MRLMVHLPTDQQHWTMSLIYTINDAYLELFSCDKQDIDYLICCYIVNFFGTPSKNIFVDKYIGNQ